MSKDFPKFGDSQIKKKYFHCFKNPIGVVNANIDMTVISNFVGYRNNEVIASLGLLFQE